MNTLRCTRIVAHVHDELIIECDPKVSLEAVCEQMGRTPPWMPGLILRADGDEICGTLYLPELDGGSVPHKVVQI